MGVGRSTLGWLAAALVTSACGLRSDPTFIADPMLDDESGTNVESTGPGDIITDPDRMGTCDKPFEIPLENTTIQGTLPDGHAGLYSGWCGDDGGVEDVYRFVSTYDTDVLFRFTETNFPITLRVQTDPCGASTDAITICTDEAMERENHFFALAGVTYWVTVDTPNPGDGGAYAFDVVLGDPPIGACPVHPETIFQSPGSAFVWGNEFSRGQGLADGRCGGPGRENMFTLIAEYAGSFSARVEGTEGYVPLLSLRTGCGGQTELLCSNAGDTGVAGVAEMFGTIPAPGTYYILVDSTSIEAGSYSFRIDFQ